MCHHHVSSSCVIIMCHHHVSSSSPGSTPSRSIHVSWHTWLFSAVVQSSYFPYCHIGIHVLEYKVHKLHRQCMDYTFVCKQIRRHVLMQGVKKIFGHKCIQPYIWRKSKCNRHHALYQSFSPFSIHKEMDVQCTYSKTRQRKVQKSSRRTWHEQHRRTIMCARSALIYMYYMLHLGHAHLKVCMHFRCPKHVFAPQHRLVWCVHIRMRINRNSLQLVHTTTSVLQTCIEALICAGCRTYTANVHRHVWRHWSVLGAERTPTCEEALICAGCRTYTDMWGGMEISHLDQHVHGKGALTSLPIFSMAAFSSVISIVPLLSVSNSVKTWNKSCSIRFCFSSSVGSERINMTWTNSSCLCCGVLMYTYWNMYEYMRVWTRVCTLHTYYERNINTYRTP